MKPPGMPSLACTRTTTERNIISIASPGDSGTWTGQLSPGPFESFQAVPPSRCSRDPALGPADTTLHARRSNVVRGGLYPPGTTPGPGNNGKGGLPGNSRKGLG